MRSNLKQLEAKMAAATGSDTNLDADLHEAAYGVRADRVPAYTSSVDACLALVHERLPEWHWHLGYGATGVFPYAVLTHGPEDADSRSEATAPTVPLALLRAFVKALAKDNLPRGV